MASSAALALVLWYGGALTADGLLLVGTLSVFMTYAQGIMEPVQWSVDCFSDLITVKVNIERVTALLAAEGDVKDTPEVIEKYGDSFSPKRENWEPLVGHVCFDDVTFRYPDGGENVLEHFSLDVPQGTNVAIVGETGAGKSTLVNLVCRFYEPTEGRILIDGRDARERSVHWLHSNIGYVLQTPHLFSGTVREISCTARRTRRKKRSPPALRAVKADGVVSRLEHGIDTRIGEGGNSLSTGEKQLLSFARAILADPAIFILDEATSSIDTLTEKLIQEAIPKADGRQDELCHRAPPFHHHAGGHHPRCGRWKDRRARHARRAFAPQGSVLRPLHEAVPRGEHPKQRTAQLNGEKKSFKHCLIDFFCVL